MPSFAMNGSGVEDDVVLTGLSGRLPESDTIEEFAQQLFDGVDLVTADGRRWTPGLHGLPERNGKLKQLAQFDAPFFGVHPKQAHVMDPQIRLLLELTHEAIVDAGINPAELRGTRTGVYIGVSSSESAEMWSINPDKINGYEVIGCCLSMFANRISYTFDLKGPSYAIDSACSSSMVALTHAVAVIRAGLCDAAIVAGTNLCLKPVTSLILHRQSVMSSKGQCAAFDADGYGYVRSEAAVVVLLQRHGAARRLYATVRGARTNTDGAKPQGITYPNGDMQRRLAAETFAEARLRPQDVKYVEAHGTGTKVGDSEEVNAIAELFCKGRKTPLLLGSVKSNMGHSEAASGLCSIAKVVVAMEHGVIPANLHYYSPKTDIPALSDGRIQVVAKNTPWEGGLVAVNSFGLGGSNAHIILESMRGSRPPPAQYSVPRLVVASGRTDEAVRELLQHAGTHARDAELHALLDAVHAQNIAGHVRRGYRLLVDPLIEEIDECESGAVEELKRRPVWFVFSGMGSQWAGMGRALFALPVFAASVARCAAALRPHGIDLQHILTEAPDDAFDNVINSFVSIVAVQVALVDLLRELGVTPDGIIGHSVGEVSCAYADETLTCEQAVLCAYWRGRSIVDAKLPPGAMAAVGLSWEQCLQRCPSDIVPACHNAADNVTVSGPAESIEKFVAELSEEGVFALLVNSSGVAFHSKYIAAAVPLLRHSLEMVIPEPRLRSRRWVSSSLPRDQWACDIAQYSSAAYHVNNLVSPVRFSDALLTVPESAVVIEVAPQALLIAVLRRALPAATHVPLIQKEAPDVLHHLLASVGKLYNAGCQLKISQLYPAVQWPVSRGTPGLASHVRWDHSIEWSVANFGTPSRSGENMIEYDLSRKDHSFLTRHEIDGRILFPSTGYLTLVWRTMAKFRNKKMEETPIVLENIQFKRVTIMSRETPTRFLISIFEGSGNFELSEGGEVVVTGTVRLANKPAAGKRLVLPSTPTFTSTHGDEVLLPLDTHDIYKELRLRGYNYGGIFRGIRSSDPCSTVGTLAWDNNWISFIESMVQFYIIGVDTRELYLPTRLQRAIIDPAAHLAAIAISSGSVPVRVLRHINVIVAGGVELSGIELIHTPRCANTQPKPKLEKYVFVPYESACFGTQDALRSRANVFTAMVQLVLENAGTLMLKIGEAALECAPEELLLVATLEAVKFELQVRTDVTLAAGSGQHGYSEMLKDLDVKISTKVMLDGEFHLVLAADVLARHGSATLTALSNVLMLRGMLMLQEPPGVMDEPAAKDMLERAGLILVSRQVALNNEFVLLRRQPVLPAQHTVIDVTDDDKYEWVPALRDALHRAETEEMRVYVVSRAKDSGVLGLYMCLQGEVGGEALRVFHVAGACDVFSLDAVAYSGQVHRDLTINVLRAGVWGCYRHLLLDDITDGHIQVEHAYVNTLTCGDLSSLRWIESPLRFAGEWPPRDFVDLCRVYYASLNLRDIMLATEKLSPDTLPDDLASQECAVGLEFSGRSSEGVRVMGLIAAQGLSTSIMADKRFLWHVPKKWSLQEAATIPVAYATAYYALCVRGHMRGSESVLIHAGAGGVGQAAIAIALHAGCTVYTTVGTADKHAFLRQRFPALPNANIGNSRDTSFKQMVLTRTCGRGVDLVLNSLAGDKLLASVQCLAYGGHFLEIGKLDLNNNTLLGMAIFLENTTFHGIQLDSLFKTDCDDEEKEAVVRCVTEGITSGAIQPLPSTVYNDQQLEPAFRCMATGNHIGKVLLEVRSEEPPGSAPAAARLISAIPRTYMHPAKSYVLVGGLGGLGLELGQWLVERGATRLVLNSRFGVRTGYQAWCIRRWREKGIAVTVSTVNVTTIEGACALLRGATSLGPVGGVFNLAAVLKDEFLEKLTPADFKVVAAPKVYGTRSLDVATRELALELDYFVVFSSVASGHGSNGQSNYGFANSAMERIVEQRQVEGLPGIAVQWGPIGDVGMIIDIMGDDINEIKGMLPQRIASCMETLGVLLARPDAVVASTVVADKNFVSAAADQQDLVHQVANILGMKDPNAVSATASLAELGIDSLMAAEIKLTLERILNVIIYHQKIRTLTFARLRELAGVEGDSEEAVTDALLNL